MGAGIALGYLIVIQASMSALTVLTIGAVSDFYDGYLARRLGASSHTGAFLDPLADKILVISAFASLWWQGMVAWWVVAVIVVRDLLITLLRIWMRRRGQSLKTLMLAKIKTGVQFASLYVFIAGSALVQGQWLDLGFSQRFALFHGLLSGVCVALITLFTLLYICLNVFDRS